nr:MAG TPA: hypothetical protein [Caudoviricetes sp.]
MIRGGALNIVVGQKFRVKERAELLSDRFFTSSHEKYCGKTLTVRRKGIHRGVSGYVRPIIWAYECGEVMWFSWMIEPIEDCRRVDENLFLSCLLL